jgi:acylphosphatase
VRYVVRGVVQGVGFRWFVLREAQRLELRGWVSNLRDGSVEVVAEGPPASLSELERVLARGPSAARVERVEKLVTPHDVDMPKFFDVR